ncbi:MAG TPA: GNAT family N-acetyltransferase [Candidatus Limiplasma sp.]|nr:GNAT family N-acetyltransferase [Candidatus Limiplasma sp.]
MKAETVPILRGTRISLRPYTPERCHAFWHDYIADPAMWAEAFHYDPAKIDRYYQSKLMDESRIYFAICHADTTVGEIQLKRIDPQQGCAALSIHPANNRYKNRGFGSEPIRLLIFYTFHSLGLKRIEADSVLRNTRSQHVLEKAGFQFLYEDAQLRYYAIDNTV